MSRAKEPAREKLPLAVIDTHTHFCDPNRKEGVPWPGKDDKLRQAMQAASRHANVCCKVSALVEGTGRDKGNAPADPAYYRPVLDVLWDGFGADRLLYGSNWPVSVRFGAYATTQGIVRPYFRDRGDAAFGKFFGKTAQRVYGLVN